MLRRVILALQSAFWRSRFESALDTELRDHMMAYRDDLIAHGVSLEEAEVRARREFGPVEIVKEDVRKASGLAWVDSLSRHFRFAVRVLRKSPGFALAVTATLALCIGANSAIFAVVDEMLFRPLPFPQPERLVRISVLTRGNRGEDEDTSVDGSTWEYLRNRAGTLDLALHARPKPVNLAADGAARYVQEMRVSSGYFRVLGVQPLFGREIDAAEDRPGGPAVAVLSYPLWSHEFGANPSIVGRPVMLRGEPYTVVGIMPRGFTSWPPADVWTPLRPATTGEGGGSNYALVARLRTGFGMREAEAELRVLASDPEAQPRVRPGLSIQYLFRSIRRATADDRQQPLGRPLLVLWAGVAVVLLIGCINVAGLILARGETRRHEIATRLAMGSSALGVSLQLLLETSLLSICGGIAGLFLASEALSLLNRLAAKPLGLLRPVAVDMRVVGATAIAVLMAATFAGLYPAWTATRPDIREALASAGRAQSPRRRGGVRGVLVVSEIALSVVLLIGFGLVLKTLMQFRQLNPGYDGHGVLAATLPLEDARYSTAGAINHLYDAGLARLRETPGIEAAGVGLTLPYQRALNDGVRVVDGPRATPENRSANVTYVTPGYFEALRFRLLRGRVFNDADREGSQPVAVINESFARAFLKDDDPLGRHLAPNREIVGIVGDVQEIGFGDPVAAIPNVYLPASQIQDSFFRLVHQWFGPSWVVRAAEPSSAVAAAMRRAVSSVDPLLPFENFRSMDEVRDDAFGWPRLESAVLGTLAGLALILSGVGIFGLIAQTVIERTREFGIRIALGSSLVRAVLTIALSGITLAVFGVGVGSGLAIWAGRLFRTLIYNVSPTDAATFALVTATLLAIGILASVAPSIRIARIDPAKTLREE